MGRDDVLRANLRVYERMAHSGDPLCRPAADKDLRDPLATVDAAGWLGGNIAGQRILCLAAGGGRQSALYAAAGADVTVADLSPAMLELDRRVAAERGLSLRLVQTSMDDLSALGESEFDVVVHPVSSCYLPDVRAVYRQVARVLRQGGVYISQHKTPASLQASTRPTAAGTYELRHRYYRDDPVPPPDGDDPVAFRLRERGAIEFLHRWEELIGGMCRAGFVIEDLVEPMHAKPDAEAHSFAARAGFVPPYVRIKARRRGPGDPPAGSSRKSLWIPGPGDG